MKIVRNEKQVDKEIDNPRNLIRSSHATRKMLKEANHNTYPHVNIEVGEYFVTFKVPYCQEYKDDKPHRVYRMADMLPEKQKVRTYYAMDNTDEEWQDYGLYLKENYESSRYKRQLPTMFDTFVGHDSGKFLGDAVNLVVDVYWCFDDEPYEQFSIVQEP